MGGGAPSGNRKVLPIRQDVNGDEINRVLHLGIAQPILPHIGISDRHRYLGLHFANDGDEVRHRDFTTEQHFIADDDAGDDVRILFGERDPGRDLAAGLRGIVGDPNPF